MFSRLDVGPASRRPRWGRPPPPALAPASQPFGGLIGFSAAGWGRFGGLVGFRPQRSDPPLRLTFAVTRPQRPAGRQHAQSQRHGQPVRGPHPPPPSAAAAFAGLNRARRAKQPPGPGRAPWLPIGWRPPTRSHSPFPHWSTLLGAHKSGSTLPFLIGWCHRPPSALDSCRPLIEPGLLAGSGRRGGGSGSVAIFGKGRGCGRAAAPQAGV